MGQTAGYFLGNAIFLSLESADFCNRWLRVESKPYGVVTLSGVKSAALLETTLLADFTFGWGLIFMISTSLVLLLKKEEASSEDIDDMGIVDAYKLLWKIIRRPAVVTLCAVLLTAKVG